MKSQAFPKMASSITMRYFLLVLIMLSQTVMAALSFEECHVVSKKFYEAPLTMSIAELDTVQLCAGSYIQQKQYDRDSATTDRIFNREIKRLEDSE